jgi:perosamine synthetase
MDAVLSCMVTDSLGPGSLCDELAGAVSEYLGLAGGIALRERSRALGMALDELSLRSGDGVVLDPLLPRSYHDVLCSRGLVPVYADVLDSSICIDPDAAERAVRSAADRGVSVAAMITHATLGFVPDMVALAALGVPIIEDLSEGIGANTGEERLGRFGRFVIVAMEPDGIITAGGGSLLLASGRNDRAAIRRACGLVPADALLPDMNAALGLIQIKEIEKYVARRSEIASVYTRALMRGRHQTPVQPGVAQNVYLTFPVLVQGSAGEVTAYARKKGVDAGLAFSGTVIDRQATSDEATDDAVPAPPGSASDYPVSRGLLLRCLRFPLYPSLTAKEIATIERVLTTLP